MCLLSRRWETWPCGHHREDEPELEEICPARRNGDVAGCNRNIRWTDEASPIILPSLERCPGCRGAFDNNANASDAMLFFRDRDGLARRVCESRRRNQHRSAGDDARHGDGPRVGGRTSRYFQTADGFRDPLRRGARSPAAGSTGSPPFSASGPRLPLALQEAIRRFRSQRPGQNNPVLIDRSIAPGAAANEIPDRPRTRPSSSPHGNRDHFGLGNRPGRSRTPMPGVGRSFQLPVTTSSPLGGLLGDVHGPGNLRGSTIFPAHHVALLGPEAGGSNNPFQGLLREIQASRNSGSGIGEMEIPVQANPRPPGNVGLGGGQTPFPVHELQDPVILSPTEAIARVPGGLLVFNPLIVGYPPGSLDGGGLRVHCGGVHQWP